MCHALVIPNGSNFKFHLMYPFGCIQRRHLANDIKLTIFSAIQKAIENEILKKKKDFFF